MSRNPFRLRVTLTHADGRKARWSGDEHKPGDVPQGLKFSKSIPGGDRDWSCALARRPDEDHPDLNLYDDVRIYAPGNKTVWAGQQQAFPGQLADEHSVQVQGVGHAIELTGDPRPWLFVDRDLQRWRDSGAAEKLRIWDVPRNYAGGPSTIADDDSGLPALLQTIRGPQGKAAQTGAWYDAGPGAKVASVYYDFVAKNLDPASTSWIWQFLAGPSDKYDAATHEVGANLRAASGSGYHPLTTPAQFVALVFLWNATTGLGDQDHNLLWRELAAYADHGLTRRGDDPGGFYLEDMIAHVVRNAAPGLRGEVGGSIEPTRLVIPHAALEPMDADKAIEHLNAPALWPWGVYGKEFFYRHPDSAYWTTWSARLAPDGAHVTYDGPQAIDARNGVVVRWRNPDGSTSIAAPPGSVYPDTDTALADTSSTNPATAQGKRRWQLLDIPYPSVRKIAVALGAAYLRERAVPQRRGTLTVRGWIRHPTKGPRPVFEVKAGDYVTVGDHVGDVPRRIIQADYDHDSRTATFTLDNTAHTVEALMEYVGIAVRDLF